MDIDELKKQVQKAWSALSLAEKIMTGFLGTVVLLIVLTMLSWSAKADELLNKNAPVTFMYAAPGATVVDNETQPTVLLGVRHSWTPVDLVAEGVLREDSGANVMVAKTWGNNRILGGVAFLNGATGIVFGADIKGLALRVVTYDTSQSVTVPGECTGRRWRRVCTPDTVTDSKSGHSAITLSWIIPLKAW